MGKVTSVAQRGSLSPYMVFSLLCIVLIGAIVIYRFGNGEEEAPRLSYSEVDKSTLERWSATLSCGPSGSSKPFEDNREILVGQGVVLLERGKSDRFHETVNPEVEIPAELPFRFEWWFGHIDDPEIDIEGWYTEGNNVVKKIEFSGYRIDDTLKFSGQRGPRECEVEATLKS